MVYLIKIIQSPEDDLDKVNKSLAVFTYRLLFQLFSCPIYILGQEKIIVRFRLPNEPNRAPPYQKKKFAVWTHIACGKKIGNPYVLKILVILSK